MIEAPPPTALQKLLKLFELEKLDVDLWRGVSPQGERRRVFGGQVIAQALVAAMRSVENRSVHSLHGYFMLPGDPEHPILYEVDRIREGRSFATRRVRALQKGKAIFAMTASFHIQEEGLSHFTPMPKLPLPDDLPDDAVIRANFVPRLPERRRAFWLRERAIELRPVDPEKYFFRQAGDEAQPVWLRINSPLPQDPTLHYALLAYTSDITLLDNAGFVHGKSVLDPEIQSASLDHALWFHDSALKADQWLLYVHDSPWTGQARGFGRALVYTQNGQLVASVAQEGLMRLVDPLF